MSEEMGPIAEVPLTNSKFFQLVKYYRHSEGKEVPVLDELAPSKHLVDELWGGISSAVSYGGYDTLTNFIGNGVLKSSKTHYRQGEFNVKKQVLR
jgi:hypothetical protein